jgi:hypothetical protein
MRRKLHWSDWSPGLDNDHLSLQHVLNSLPAAAPEQIPWQVRALENPSSPIAFPGAISLQRHDAIHALLGRGLSSQDEAFVIGYTMGAARKIRSWQFAIFRFVATRLYPKPYRFQSSDLIAFDIGFAQGQQGQARDLHTIALETMGEQSLQQLRHRLGINVHALHAAYRTEAALLPQTISSRRLDKDFGGVDPSDLQPPDAPESNWQREGALDKKAKE